MQGFGVNTYKWTDAQAETKLVKCHWMPSCGVASMTEEDAAAVQTDDLGHASKDLHDAIERDEFPEWELLVQMMDDHDHPELDFDPLDDTNERLHQLVGQRGDHIGIHSAPNLGDR